MPNLKLLFSCSLLLVGTTAFSQFSAMTYNIRYDNRDDGDNWWGYRKEELADLLQYYRADFIGLQEALPQQTEFIDEQLPDYSYIGFGRDGEGTNSEGAPIFYQPARHKLLAQQVIWLSPTPVKVSKGWDAALNRICVYGVFETIGQADTIHVFNCHFDHRGEEARQESARLLTQLLTQYDLQDQQVVLMGDLNAEPDDEPLQLLREHFDDSYTTASHPPYGPVGTWCGFDTSLAATKRIDYILSKNLTATHHRAIDDRRKNNLYPSDHLPVLVHFQ